MDKATPESAPANAEGVMAIAFELARIREEHGAQSGMYLSEVRALRAEVERLAAQAAPTEAPQEFESAQGRALASAWAEGWAQCRDAEYVGEEAQNDAFNQSHTLAQCLDADQTRFQGGLSNDQLRRAWGAKLPNVIPTDEQLTAFALGIEVAAQPSQAPVVQAGEYPPLPVPTGQVVTLDMVDGRKARVIRAIDPHWMVGADGKTLFTEEQMRAYVDADRASRAPAVRMLTREELNDVALSDQVGWEPGEYIEAVQRKFCAVNAGRTIPASGEIGSV